MKPYGRTSKTRRILVMLIVATSLLLGLATPILAAGAESNGPTVTTEYLFDPGWSVENSHDWQGGIGAFGFEIGAEFGYEYFAGISLPLLFRVSYPEWLVRDSPFNISIAAEGRPGRAGICLGAGIKLTMANPWEKWEVLTIDRSLDLTVDYQTPIGRTYAQDPSLRIPLGEVTVPVINYNIEVFLGVDTEIVFETELCTRFVATASSLVEGMDRNLAWSCSGECKTLFLATTSTAKEPVSCSMKDTFLRVKDVGLRVARFYLELCAPGFPSAFLEIPVPTIELSLAAGSGSAPGFLQSDGSQREANLEMDGWGIPVFYPEEPSDSDSFVVSLVVGGLLVAGTIGLAMICMKRDHR